MAHHTHTDTCTQRHTQTNTDTIFTFNTFYLIWHTCQKYKCYIWHTTDLPMHRHSDMHMYRDIDTEIQIHTDICMFVYKHKHTHTHHDMHVGNLRKLLVQIHFQVKIDQNCYFKHEIWGNCYLKAILSYN